MIDLAQEIIDEAMRIKEYKIAKETTQILYDLFPNDLMKKQLKDLEKKIKSGHK